LHSRWDSSTMLSIQRPLFSPLGPFHRIVPCQDLLFGCLLFVLISPSCFIATHLMIHSLNLDLWKRDLVVIGSVLFEYSVAGYLGSKGECKRRDGNCFLMDLFFCSFPTGLSCQLRGCSILFGFVRLLLRITYLAFLDHGPIQRVGRL
jgi:hypothetical protein